MGFQFRRAGCCHESIQKQTRTVVYSRKFVMRGTRLRRIRQIKAKALRKMRHPTRIRKLEGFIELPGA